MTDDTLLAIDSAADAMARLGQDPCPKRPGVPQSLCQYCLVTAAVQGIASAGLLMTTTQSSAGSPNSLAVRTPEPGTCPVHGIALSGGDQCAQCFLAPAQTTTQSSVARETP